MNKIEVCRTFQNGNSQKISEIAVNSPQETFEITNKLIETNKNNPFLKVSDREIAINFYHKDKKVGYIARIYNIDGEIRISKAGDSRILTYLEKFFLIMNKNTFF